MLPSVVLNPEYLLVVNFIVKVVLLYGYIQPTKRRAWTKCRTRAVYYFSWSDSLLFGVLMVLQYLTAPAGVEAGLSLAAKEAGKERHVLVSGEGGGLNA